MAHSKLNKNLFVNIGLLVFAVLIFFCLLEIILRVIEPKPKYNTENEFVFYEYDSILGWKNKPNASGVFNMSDSSSYVKINSKGLRDSEHNYSKINGKIRIQFYGDSFTWGYGVDAENRYANIFSNEAEKQFLNKYEIMDFGVTGYGTDQEYLLLKNEGIKYSPDIIVFAYHNDLSDISQKEAYTYPRPFFMLDNGKLKLTNTPVPKRSLQWEERPSVNENRILSVDFIVGRLKYSYDFLKTEFKTSSLAKKFFKKSFGKSRLDEKTENSLKVLDSILLETKKIADKNNAKFVIITIPDKSQVYGSANSIEINHLVEFGEKNNILVINLLPDIKEVSRNERDLYFQIDGHFSKKGNEIFGKLLFKKLVNAKILN